MSVSAHIKHRLRNTGSVPLVALTVVFAIAFTGVLNYLQSWYLWGSMPFEIFMMGTIDAFFVSLAASVLILLLAKQLVQSEELKRQAEIVQEREQKYRLIAETMTDVVWVFDIERRQMLYVSPSISRLTGYTAEEFAALAPHYTIRQESIQFAKPTLLKEVEQFMLGVLPESSFTLELSTTHRSGHILWMETVIKIYRNDISGRIELHGVSRDVTARKESELKVRELNDRYKRIIEETNAVAYQRDHRTKKYLFMSDTIERLIGYSAGELSVDCWKSIIQETVMHGEAAGLGFEETVRRTVAGEFTRWHADLKITTKAGLTKWISDVSIQIPGPDGSPIGSLGMLYDITDRKVNEEALRTAQNMESIGTLAGGIAHDFNNLLSAIIGNVEFAMKKREEADPSQINLRHIMSAAERAAELTRQLLTYSGKGSIQIEYVELNRLIRDLMPLIQRSLSEHISIQQFLSPEPLWIRADQSRIEQMFLNLLTNANEAIGDQSGIVKITSSVCSLSESEVRGFHWRSPSMNPGQFVKIEIRDSGIGIPAGILQKIFDPFFSTKFTGRGLGLPAVLGAVRSHEGAVSVQSEPGQGTSFSIFLPIREKDAKPSSDMGPTQAPKLTLAESCILVVEDEDLVRSLIAGSLEQAGATVLEAEDGIKGVQVFRENQEKIDLVVLDLSMPKMGGAETLQQLKQIDPTVKIILSSGYSESESTRMLRPNDISAFLQKPYKSHELVRLVTSILGLKQ